MKKYLIAGISVVALSAATAAFAQDKTTAPKPADTMQNQSAQPQTDAAPAAKSSPDLTAPAPEAATAPVPSTDSATAPSADAGKVTSADGSGTRASTLIGATVYNTANEAIGDINDLIVGQDGQISHVVVGVGGFLGMGERNVALSFSELDLQRDADNKLRVSSTLTKSDLETMPEWKKSEIRG